jgi:hypothetical protein
VKVFAGKRFEGLARETQLELLRFRSAGRGLGANGSEDFAEGGAFQFGYQKLAFKEDGDPVLPSFWIWG